MKIFERILYNRIRDIVEIAVNHIEFVKNYTVSNAIHATRLLMNYHHENWHSLYPALRESV